MTHRHNVSIREHQIVRFSIEVETDQVRAAILEARKQYQHSGTRSAGQAETEIDDAKIFAVNELDPKTGLIVQSFDFESLSASVGAPIDLSNCRGKRGFACDLSGCHAVLPVKASAPAHAGARERASRGPDGSAAA